MSKLRAGLLLLPWTHTPYGYRVDPDRPRDPAGVRPDEEKAAVVVVVVVAEIFAMYLEECASLFGISKKLKARGILSPRGRKIWTVSTLRGILTTIPSTRVRFTPGA